ncbi:hypothetical protein BDZ89DRAFT_1141922 [Hymenopellis radicata]|nr:hypothetical protein BDZ89DRAFT_1141922 [Hymenopellis radicata]
MATTSNTQLAQLLSDSYQEIEALRASLAEEKRRADYYQSMTSSTASTGNSNTEQDRERERERRQLMERVRVAEERVYATERQRDEEVGRRVALIGLLERQRRELDGFMMSEAGAPRVPKRRNSVEREGQKRARHHDSDRDIDEMILKAADPHQPPHPSANPYPPSGSKVAGEPFHSGQILDAPSTASASLSPDVKIYPAVNEHGQRTCRSCGQPGRYKEDKCVEKWGPGPMGPGTVCDRCRKKMKRLERRETIGSIPVPQLARNNIPIPPPAAASTSHVSASPPKPVSSPRVIQPPQEEELELDADGRRRRKT